MAEPQPSATRTLQLPDDRLVGLHASQLVSEFNRAAKKYLRAQQLTNTERNHIVLTACIQYTKAMQDAVDRFNTEAGQRIPSLQRAQRPADQEAAGV